MFTNFKNRLIIVIIALSILLPLIVANNANAIKRSCGGFTILVAEPKGGNALAQMMPQRPRVPKALV